MLLKKYFTCVIFLLFLSSCAINQDPRIVYDQDVPLSETSVFSAFPYPEGRGSRPLAEGIILKVDGKELTLSPKWVRVLPGPHTFFVRYNFNFRSEGAYMKWNYYDFQVTIPEMQPRHVYVARYIQEQHGIKIIPDDVGENAGFTVTLDIIKKIVPVKF